MIWGKNDAPNHKCFFDTFADIVNELIIQGATIDATGKDGQTPLHIAADKVTPR